MRDLERVRRRLWMKAFPWLRAYRCTYCGKVQLVSRKRS